METDVVACAKCRSGFKCAAHRPVRRLHSKVPENYTAEMGWELTEKIIMAMKEAGHPVEALVDDSVEEPNVARADRNIPLDVYDKARELVFTAHGIECWWEDE